MRKGLFAVLILWLVLPMGTAFAKGDLPRPPPEPTWNYQGVWWGSPSGSEPGWAIGITHQGTSIHATWFTYDADGTPTWFVMPDAARRYDWSEDTYSGPLYRATGPAFNAEPWDTSLVSPTPVGIASFTFSGSGSGTFTFAMGRLSRTRRIERQLFSAPVPTCVVGGTHASTPNYTDLWGLEPGWGVHIAHQGNVLFAAWFTYRPDGKGEWLVMTNGARIGRSTYSGTLYRTRGPAFDASPWNPAQVRVTPVGRATFTFVEEYDNAETSPAFHDYATFDYTLDGASGSKRISRETFASPQSVCN